MARGGCGELRVGTSGYQYRHWRARFYPPKLPSARWFEYYARHFDTVKINNTFYHVPPTEVFVRWRHATPAGFRYALKYSRFGSHMKHLKDPADHLAYFLERVAPLASTLGPILLQLPPRWRIDVARLDDFLAAAPRRCRWAVELREPSWLNEEVYAVLRARRAALCLHDLLPGLPRLLTTRWTYLRFHGPEDGRRYTRRYSPQGLSATARRVHAWLADGVDVYAYFNNDHAAHAVDNALMLRRYVERRGCG